MNNKDYRLKTVRLQNAYRWLNHVWRRIWMPDANVRKIEPEWMHTAYNDFGNFLFQRHQTQNLHRQPSLCLQFYINTLNEISR